MGRLIDADALLHGIDELAQSPWFNHGKEDTGIPRVGYNERKEAVEIVRDLCIKAAPTVALSDQHITINWTPDLDKLARDVAFRGLDEFSFMGKSIREWVEIILEQTSRRWVSVEDRLPGEYGRYLCWFGKNKMLVGADVVLYLPDERAFWNLEWNKPIENVTHWMPIEPPEEVQG